LLRVSEVSPPMVGRVWSCMTAVPVMVAGKQKERRDVWRQK
jgi:hypothetical protein